MREILFRGKRKDNDEWVQGYYIETLRYNNLYWIWDGKEYVQIDPETVGQYTGLTDKNGKKIFEGDIIKSCEYEDTYSVEYCDYYNYPAFDCDPEVTIADSNGLSYLVNSEGVEVIGNIHDNPELLKGGADDETLI